MKHRGIFKAIHFSRAMWVVRIRCCLLRSSMRDSLSAGSAVWRCPRLFCSYLRRYPHFRVVGAMLMLGFSSLFVFEWLIHVSNWFDDAFSYDFGTSQHAQGGRETWSLSHRLREGGHSTMLPRPQRSIQLPRLHVEGPHYTPMVHGPLKKQLGC